MYLYLGSVTHERTNYVDNNSTSVNIFHVNVNS